MELNHWCRMLQRLVDPLMGLLMFGPPFVVNIEILPNLKVSASNFAHVKPRRSSIGLSNKQVENSSTASVRGSIWNLIHWRGNDSIGALYICNIIFLHYVILCFILFCDKVWRWLNWCWRNGNLRTNKWNMYELKAGGRDIILDEETSYGWINWDTKEYIIPNMENSVDGNAI